MSSTIAVGGMTLLSRVFGLLRDITLATLFGASGGTDAFLVAFKIPNFMRRLFAEGAFSQAFVPVFSEYKENKPEQLRDLIDHVAGRLGGILLLITIVCSLAAPLLVMLFAPGFIDEPERFDLTADMLRITFPYLFFIALVAFAGGILNSFNQFAVPAFTPVLLNLCLIAAAYWAAPLFEQPLMALAWGVFAAGFVQLLFQLPMLAKLGMIPRPKFDRHHAGVRKIMRLMLPAILGSSVAQINLLLDTVIASFLAVGSVSWLYYSDRLLEFPLGVLGIAVATVILPALSQQHARASGDEFNQTLNWATRLVCIIAVPAAAGLLVMAAPVLASLFQYGEFDAHDTQMASLSLMAYITGLPAFILIKVLAPGYYARQDTRTPVRIGIVAMLANMAMNIVFVLAMLRWQLAPAHVGLALATSASGWLNALLLYRGLRHDGSFIPAPGWGRLWRQVLAATAAMAGLLLLLSPAGEIWYGWTLGSRLFNLGWLIAVAVLCYFAALWLLGLRPRHLKKH